MSHDEYNNLTIGTLENEYKLAFNYLISYDKNLEDLGFTSKPDFIISKYEQQVTSDWDMEILVYRGQDRSVNTDGQDSSVNTKDKQPSVFEIISDL